VNPENERAAVEKTTKRATAIARTSVGMAKKLPT